MYRSFAIAGRPPCQRFHAFHETVDSLFSPTYLQAGPSSRNAFRGAIQTVELDNLPVACVSSDPLLVRRRPQEIARLSEAAYLVKFQLSGESVWVQRGREIHARPGDFYVASTAEPYALQFPEQYQMAVLVLSPPAIRRLTANPDQFLGRKLSAREADCGLLSSFVTQLVHRMSRLPPVMIPRLKATVLDLLSAVLQSRSGPHPLTREQLLAQLKEYIRLHLSDRHLGPGTLAKVFGVSERYIHALFEPQGMTVCQHIRSLRLAECRAALEQSTPGAISLTDLALRWGFYDLSHMTRHFRREFGVSPRQLQLAGIPLRIHSCTSPVR